MRPFQMAVVAGVALLGIASCETMQELTGDPAKAVADRQALTPTEAAEIVTPDSEELLKGLAGINTRLAELVYSRLELGRRKLDELVSRRGLARPLDRIHDAIQRLDDDADRLHRAMGNRALLARKVVEGHAARLESLSPLNVLARGYSLTRKEDGAVVRSAGEVQPGDVLVTTLHQGEVRSRVDGDEH